jgi:TATA-binding protein-associated factor
VNAKLGGYGSTTNKLSSTPEFAWQVRHAGLVGIKYEVAVRPDLFDDPQIGQEVLRGVVEAAVSGYASFLIR